MAPVEVVAVLLALLPLAAMAFVFVARLRTTLSDDISLARHFTDKEEEEEEESRGTT